MDLRAQISQLDRAIEVFDANIATMKEKRMEAERKRKVYSRLLVAAEALEEQKPETKK